VTEPHVPNWLSYVGAWGWRIVAGAAAFYVILYVAHELRLVVLPFVFGVILASLLEPMARWLRNHKLPRLLAAILSTLVGLSIVAGILTLFVIGVVGELPELGRAVQRGYRDLVQLVVRSPIDVTRADLEQWVDGQLESLQEQAGSMAQQVMTSLIAVAQVLAMFILTIVFALLFAWDGDRQFERTVKVLPARQQKHATEIGNRAWGAVGGYIRGMFIVATFDAVFFGLALWILDVPLVLPIMLFTFIGAFVPFVGAILATVIGGLVALAHDGLTTALLVVLAGTIVQQVESNVLDPIVMSRTVKLHPAMVLFAITAGGVLAGIPGVFLAIPIAGAFRAILLYAREQNAI
jgi:putative heme transporter